MKFVLTPIKELIEFISQIFQDEQEYASMSRTLLVVFSALSVVVVWYVLTGKTTITVQVLSEILRFLTAIILSLIGWAGGARLAQYMFPQLGNIVGAFGNTLKTTYERWASGTSSATEPGTEDEEIPGTTDLEELSSNRKTTVNPEIG